LRDKLLLADGGHSLWASKNQREKTMPDKPMKDDDQGQRRESPGQTTPMTQPDTGNQGDDKNRRAQDDEDLQKKQGPGRPTSTPTIASGHTRNWGGDD